jgi:predicted molibdopterin-dependent oxidoreductase YjgC
MRALINIGLARGLPCRPNAGLVPIRGHSGVQGGAEVGCQPRVSADTRAQWTEAWGFPVPDAPGWTAAEMVDHAARGDVDLFWIVGGNFLETLGDESRSRAALARPRLRIHHDIVFSSSMLIEGEGDVLLLPATTRYESPGGSTETSTERRIIFSPEIPGRRIAEAKPEWWVFREVMARARPDSERVGLEDAARIRQEIARAVPLYAGIETLRSKGDQVQWGGRRLFADGRFATADGKARFAPVSLRAPESAGDGFKVSTRRGKQFNSMVQREVDPLTGSGRHDVLISAEDLANLQMESGSWATLRSPHGSFTGRLVAAPIRPGNLEVHWPEGNVLLDGARLDPESMEPDYNAVVVIEPGRSPAASSESTI